MFYVYPTYGVSVRHKDCTHPLTYDFMYMGTYKYVPWHLYRCPLIHMTVLTECDCVIFAGRVVDAMPYTCMCMPGQNAVMASNTFMEIEGYPSLD